MVIYKEDIVKLNWILRLVAEDEQVDCLMIENELKLIGYEAFRLLDILSKTEAVDSHSDILYKNNNTDRYITLNKIQDLYEEQEKINSKEREEAFIRKWNIKKAKQTYWLSIIAILISLATLLMNFFFRLFS